MSYIPGLDLSSMSDEQLFERESEIHRKMMFASRFTSGQAVAQFQAILAAIANERRERMMRKVFELRKAAFPEVIESDPDLRPAKETQRGPVERPSSPRARPTVVRRTNRPTDPDGEST